MFEKIGGNQERRTIKTNWQLWAQYTYRKQTKQKVQHRKRWATQTSPKPGV